MHGIQVILFDLDDTLICFEDYWEASLRETFRRHKATGHLDSDLLFDVLWEQNMKFEQQYLNQQITLRQFRNFRLVEALLQFDHPIDESTADDFNELHKTISKSYMSANPEIIRLLEQLSSVYALGIVTNGTASWQADKIEAMDIGRFFAERAILISEDVGVEKPAPKIYEQALQVFRIAPEQALFIGDSWQNDVEGPGKSGIRSIWINAKGADIPEPEAPYLLATVTNVLDIKPYLLATHPAESK